jgi:hypothetical protein
MVSRNRDKISFALCLTSGIIGALSLLLTCIGVGIPSWYIGTNANRSIIIAEANLFYSCFAPNFTQNQSVSSLTCTSYSSFSCSTSSYQSSVLNTTVYLSGCTNPTNGSSSFSTYTGPIYQIFIDDFNNLRSGAALSILSILFILFSTIFAFIAAFILMNIYLIFIGPILAFISVIFGISCLAVASSVLYYTGPGFILFLVGILLEFLVTTLLSIVAGRSNERVKQVENNDVEPIYITRITPTHHSSRVSPPYYSGHVSSPVIIRRVHKIRV